MKPCSVTNWASPTFIIPKPHSNTVRWVSDVWELNKVLKQLKYPVPRIQDIMLKQQGYSYFIKIDLSMMFIISNSTTKTKSCALSSHHLENSSMNKQLLMIIKVSPDFAQSMIKKRLDDLGIKA